MGFANLRKKLQKSAGSANKGLCKKFSLPSKFLVAPGKEMETNGHTSAKDVVTNVLRHVSDKKEALIGVDITPGHVRICQMNEHNDNWALTHIASTQIENHESVQDIKDNKDAYTEALKSLLIEEKIHVHNAAVAIPISDAIIKTLTIPNMTDEQIEQAIEMGSFWQNLVDLPGELEDYSLFYEVMKRDKESNTMDIIFVASRKEAMCVYTDIIKGASLEPSIVDVRCFALSNIYHVNRHHTLDDAPTVFLKFGPDENYIHIIDQGESYIYDIYISDDERNSLMHHFNDAEIMQRFATQARQIVATHQAQHNCKAIENIFVVSLLPAIGTFVQKLDTILTSFNVSECNFFDHIDIPEEYKERIEKEENRSSWAVVMGLAARKLDIFDHFKDMDGADNVNLVQGFEDSKKEKRVKLVSLAVLVPIIVVCLSIASLSMFAAIKEDRELSEELAALGQVETMHSQKAAQFAKARSTNEQLAALETLAQELSGKETDALSAYRHISQVIPEGVWLTELSFKAPNTLVVKGNSMSDQNVLAFIKSLKKNSLFEQASLKTLFANPKFAKSGTMVKLFSIECILSDKVASIKVIEETNEVAKV